MSDAAKLSEMDRAIVAKDEVILNRIEAFETEITAELEGLRALIAEANRLQSQLLGGQPCTSFRGALAGTITGRPIWGRDALPQLVEGIRSLRRRQAWEKHEAEHAAEIAAAHQADKRAAEEREKRARERANSPEWLAHFMGRR